MKDLNDILKKPVITEKTAAQNEKGIYTFIVDKRANKIEIAKAIEKMYGVEVYSVNTSIHKGKPKNRYTKSKVVTGRTSEQKKAIVRLKEGQFIDLFNE
ncbi:MAG: 50S ribosomal protein L23 [Microscillaceae bacterium]|nr:50S ribosomal protein L23 [Microscillaceae bacterium]MDW8461837.1 50S ribosomal protein L23 [Cytophagales bacterium]